MQAKLLLYEVYAKEKDGRGINKLVFDFAKVTVACFFN